ncbi:hypothetical protein T440DRAFT_428048 [Plenodomus tracheiphilus IPT5]|uniref:Uncharacterized protein n=1 Tax=Plenodomus tracheiphilus IPT5 TaxID=1408161 RepID=A0A6A7B2D4_9PLEO|nr:hypothetical protein T440DRAFT_428048 [Plenodomus tracheiphilus IPT5]
MSTHPGLPGGPVTSEAVSTRQSSFATTSCGENCPVNPTPVSGADRTSSDPSERASSTTESGAAESVSTNGSNEQTRNPFGENTQGGTTTIVSESLKSYPTPSQSTIFVPTVESSSTGAISLQTDGAGSGNSSSGLSSGAVAGIAIATLIAGAAIAFVAAFLLFTRRNRTRESNVANKDYNNYADSTPEFVMMQQHKNVGMGGRNSPYIQVSQTPTRTPAVIPTPLPASAQQSEGVDVAAFLSPVASENKVYNRVMTLFRDCHSHVETYYRDVHASITPSMEPDLAQFGAKDINMAELLQDCSSPTTVLKHAIVAYALGITTPRSEEPGETIFPSELRSIFTQDDHSDSVDPNVTAVSTLHRRLSVYLFNAATSTTVSRRNMLTQSNAREAAEHFSLTFFPWANPSSSDRDRDDALAGLIHMALNLSIWLYGEPFLYEFDWEETGRRGVLVSPSLVRRTGGVHEDDKKVVVEGVVMAV